MRQRNLFACGVKWPGGEKIGNFFKKSFPEFDLWICQIFWVWVRWLGKQDLILFVFVG